MNKKTFPGIFLLFFIILLFQSSTYNFETLDWDVNAFLVTSLEIGRGNLPFENQYENKPPLLFTIFYLLQFHSYQNYLIQNKLGCAFNLTLRCIERKLFQTVGLIYLKEYCIIRATIKMVPTISNAPTQVMLTQLISP